MAKYRKRPVVVEAVQWTGKNTSVLCRFCPTATKAYNPFGGKIDHLIIPTLEGNHKAQKSDWIIKGVKGEFYPCKPDIFEQTYEKVEE